MTVAPTPVHGRRAPHPSQLALVRYDVFGGSSSSSAVQGSGRAATQTRECITGDSSDAIAGPTRQALSYTA